MRVPGFFWDTLYIILILGEGDVMYVDQYVMIDTTRMSLIR